jgi:hypothetical protein
MGCGGCAFCDETERCEANFRGVFQMRFLHCYVLVKSKQTSVH